MGQRSLDWLSSYPFGLNSSGLTQSSCRMQKPDTRSGRIETRDSRCITAPTCQVSERVRKSSSFLPLIRCSVIGTTRRGRCRPSPFLHQFQNSTRFTNSKKLLYKLAKTALHVNAGYGVLADFAQVFAISWGAFVKTACKFVKVFSASLLCFVNRAQNSFHQHRAVRVNARRHGKNLTGL